MNEIRDEIVRRVRAIAGQKPVRWADGRTTHGDFEGRSETLEVFNVPAAADWDLYVRLSEVSAFAEEKLGDFLLVFHTPEATAQHYSWVLADESEGAVWEWHRMVARTLQLARNLKVSPATNNVTIARGVASAIRGTVPIRVWTAAGGGRIREAFAARSQGNPKLFDVKSVVVNA